MVRRAVVRWVLLGVALLWAVPSWALLPPEGLTVLGVTDSSVELAWSPPPDASGGEFYNVYRNGKRMGMGPVPETSLQVFGLAPSTPQIFTVEVADPTGFPLSDMSNRVGTVTMEGAVLRVPEEVPTIQDALWFAGPGTTVLVAAGTYRQPGLWFGAERVTLKGAGAGATVIDLDGQFLDLAGFGDQAVVGVSITNGPVIMGREDTLAASALLDGPFENVAGGGFVTNCVFDRPWGVPAYVGPGEHLTIANSIFMAPDPIYTQDGPSSVLLLHNDFTQWPDSAWLQYPGEGNFNAPPDFECGYSLWPGSLCVDAGTDVGLEWFGAAPDVGPYEFGLPGVLLPPQNLRVEFAGPQDVQLSWDPVCGTVDVEVFRNGQSMGTVPGGFPSFMDWGLPPETPVTYTARTVDYTGASSAMSNRVGTRTDLASMFLRVPQDHPTIQEAIDLAIPGMRIEVAPGTYAEPLTFFGKDGIVLACQDANACTIDLRGTGQQIVDLDPWGGAVTVSGFTFRGATVVMGLGDTLANSVIDETPYEGVVGGGLIANCVITGGVGGPGFRHELGTPAVIANTIIGPYPAIDYYDTPTPWLPEPLVLLHNNFVNDPVWADFPPAGTGNFSAFPLFAPPGPPETYYLEYGDMGWDAGFKFGPDFVGLAPDVGAFEVGTPVTARPPSGLAATWDPQALTVDLSWTPSPDDPSLSPDVQVWEYQIYRSEVPGEPVYTGTLLGTLPPGYTSFQDVTAILGVTYHYQVVAFSGFGAKGELLTAPTESVSVTAVNDPPVAGDDAYAVDEDQPLLVTGPGVLSNDADPEGATLICSLDALPQYGSVALHPDGGFEYLPPADFHGVDQFAYRATDDIGQSDVAVVTITVNPVNDPPTATDDSTVVDEDAAVVVDVLANDWDVDGDILSITGITHGSNGTVTIGGATVTYTPAPDFNGADTFSYTVEDGNGGSDTATVQVTVIPVNDAPAAMDDSGTTPMGTTVTVGVLANDSDRDGDALAVAGVTQGANGSVVTNGVTVTYTPADDFHGTDQFAYTVTDGSGGSATAQVLVTVVPRYLRVIGLDLSTATARNVTTATALLSVVDESAAPLPGVVVSGHWEGLTADVDAGTTSGAGTLSVDSDGVKKAAGTYTFVVDSAVATNYLLDTAGSVVTASIQYPEPAANQPPVAVDDATGTDLDTPVVVAVLTNDSDPDGDPLTVVALTQPANGSAVLNGDQTVTYTPNPGFLGTDAFTYTVEDDQGGSAQAAVSVVVSDPGAASAMHVADIAMDVIPKKVTKATAEVLVVDTAGSPVAGATVSGVWSGPVSGTATAVTDTSGIAVFSSPGAKGASGQTFTFTVADVSLEGWVYDAAANVETEASILVP